MFLIYADRGGGGEALNPDYYRAAYQPRSTWKLPDAGRVAGIQTRPQEYEERVIRFFDGALLGAG